MSKTTSVRAVTWPALGLLLTLSCAPRARPNLILISVDTLRADHLSCYNAEGPSTPHLDALAADGILFEQAASHYPLTLPSHASMLTGLLPFEHGLRNNDVLGGLPAGSALAEKLKSQGYTTGAVVSAFVLDRRFGLAVGFDHYVDELPGQPSSPRAERRGEATTDLALALLDRLTPPFFLFVHYFDPHFPYDPPPPFRDERYPGEVRYADQQIGRLLDALKEREQYEDAAVVMTSDHGEGLGEHGEREHGFFLYQSTLHVPLLLKLPGGQDRGHRVTDAVGLTDVAHTLGQLAGVTSSLGDHSRDLRRPDTSRAGLYSETLSPLVNHGASPLVALRSDAYKFIEAPLPELYDLLADPHEVDNLVDARFDEASAMRQRLIDLHPVDWMRQANPLQAVRTDPATAQRLETLGYVSARDAAPVVDRPDPKLVMRTLVLVRAGDVSLAQGDTAQAERRYREAIEETVSDWKATYKLATLQRTQRRYDDAVATYQRLLERHPRLAVGYFNQALIYADQERWEQSLALVDKALGIEAHRANWHSYRGVLLFQMGKVAEARVAWERSLSLNPNQDDVRRYLQQTQNGD